MSRRHSFFDHLESRALLHSSIEGAPEHDDHTEAPSRAVVAVNAGGAELIDSDGQRFVEDSGFTGGKSVSLSSAVAETTDDTLFATVRQGKSFSFSARVPNGKYTLKLLFADDGATTRRFTVTAEDQKIISGWTIIGSAGVSTALVRKFNVDVRDGRMSLGFEASRGVAAVSGIVLTPGHSFFPNPISWQSRGELSLRREEAMSFVADGELYVLGGYVDSAFAATYRVERFDPVTGRVERLADMPAKITHAGVAVDSLTRTVWFVGGYIGDFPAPPGTIAVWKYSLENDTWSPGPSLPAARGAGGAAIIGRKLYFFGGANKNRTADQDDHWALDLRNPTVWRARAPLPNARNHFSVAVVSDKIYAIGGQHLLEADSINQSDLHTYDVTTDTWTALAPMPRPYSHFTFSTGVFNNRFIVTAGGESPHDVGRADVYAFDTRRNRWGELTSLPGDRRAPSGGIIGNRMYVLGGYERELGQTVGIWSANLEPAFQL